MYGLWMNLSSCTFIARTKSYFIYFYVSCFHMLSVDSVVSLCMCVCVCVRARVLVCLKSNSNLFHVSYCGLCDGDEVFASSIQLSTSSISVFMDFFPFLFFFHLDFRQAYNIYLLVVFSFSFSLSPCSFSLTHLRTSVFFPLHSLYRFSIPTLPSEPFVSVGANCTVSTKLK